MKHFASILLSIAILLSFSVYIRADGTVPRRLSLQSLEDKVRGGWAGQMIGVAYGAPTEFRSNGKIYESPIPWSPERVSNALQQDDLYVEMTFAEVMDTKGLEATSEDFGEMFKNSKYSLWHANAAARRQGGSRGNCHPAAEAQGPETRAVESGHPRQADLLG